MHNFLAMLLGLLASLLGVGALDSRGAVEAADQLTPKSQVEWKLHLATRGDVSVGSIFELR